MPAIVLLAFSDLLTLNFYAEFLLARQFVVKRATTQAAALAAVRTASPDVIVIDGVGIKRRSFCRELDRVVTTPTVPVIALVQPGSNPVPKWARGTTCETGLTMPCLPEALVEEIDRQLARAARQRSASAVRRR